MAVDISKIKLIIWDLDDTLWRGTLSEGAIDIDKSNFDLIVNLSKRGIVSSICSKNDFEITKKELCELSLWDYFVFPSINWEPKGQRLAEIISVCNLRAENVLFVDDNPSNLKEAEYYNRGLMTSEPAIISKLEASIRTIGKNDKELSRLKQYKVLEAKHSAQESASSNEQFLHSSNIRVTINTINSTDMALIDRLLEMIQRTNQLNFTKFRISKEELRKLISDSNFSVNYYEAQDNFGDYGIIGFSALEKQTKTLLHFLFSCRTMGMGIEQYVYAYLGYPHLKVCGEVAIVLNDRDSSPWINSGGFSSADDTLSTALISNKRVLVHGPCDLQAVFGMMNNSDSFDYELHYQNPITGIYVSGQSHSINILKSLDLEDSEIEYFEDSLPLFDRGIFKTGVFSKQYDVIFLSSLYETAYGLYKSKTNGLVGILGRADTNMTLNNNCKDYVDLCSSFLRPDIYDREVHKIPRFIEEYEFVGRISVEESIRNYNQIIELIDEKAMVVIMLPSLTPYDRTVSEIAYAEHKASFHSAFIKAFQGKKNVRFVDFNEYVKTPADYMNHSDHFSKEVYYCIAKDIAALFSDAEIGVAHKKLYYSTISVLERFAMYFKKTVKRQMPTLFNTLRQLRYNMSAKMNAKRFAKIEGSE